jgi:hypothetical protein
LKALAQEAALAAMTRSADDDPTPAVEHRDFVEALARHRAGAAAHAGTFRSHVRHAAVAG